MPKHSGPIDEDMDGDESVNRMELKPLSVDVKVDEDEDSTKNHEAENLNLNVDEYYDEARDTVSRLSLQHRQTTRM